jgi:protein N-terminal methyltransferase
MDPAFLAARTDPFEVSPQEIFDYYGSNYYDGSLKHWSEQPATVSGMLHGQVWVNIPDLDFSRRLVDLYITEHSLPIYSCADVGSGIGRVSVSVLSDYFKVIDVVDPVEEFVVKAEEDLRDAGVRVTKTVAGAQDWSPKQRYDTYWLQWTLSFLTDKDAVAFLKRCTDHLSPNGVIFVKDNAVPGEQRDKALFVPLDRTLARTMRHYRELFIEAGLAIDFVQPQPNWPADKFLPMYVFALKPA